MPSCVMVACQTLNLEVKVRILTGQLVVFLSLLIYLKYVIILYKEKYI